MLVQGRLLCAAARVVGSGAAPAARPPGPGARHDSPETDAATLATELTAAEAKLTELDAAVGPDAKDPKAVPIDLATRTRAACLGLLTRARRAQSSTAAKGAGSSDALLQELSAFAARVGGMSPERDERGVVLVLRSVFDTKDGLTAPAKSALSEVDRVAAAHPSFPVAVVVHSDRALATADRARWQARVKAIGDLLGSVPENRRVLLVAGDAVPVVDGKGKDRAKNDRVEIVFISPEAL
jgi:hypothetical protein